MTEFVRVSSKHTGHHITITRAELDANPSWYGELKQPALDANGRPRRPKFKVDISTITPKQPAPNDAGLVVAKANQTTKADKATEATEEAAS